MRRRRRILGETENQIDLFGPGSERAVELAAPAAKAVAEKRLDEIARGDLADRTRHRR